MARRSGLGKGLSALIPTEVSGDRSSALRQVPIGSITPNPRQPRVSFDEDTMATLTASIKELGVIQPVLVRQIGSEAADEYELIAGERRWRAARRAGLQTIPVLVQTANETHSLEQALVENLHRQDLNVLEEAAAYQQLIEEFGYTHDQVATRVGKSRTAVTNILRLLQLPSGVQRLVVDGQITPGHAAGPTGHARPGLSGDAGQGHRRRGPHRPGRRGSGPPARRGPGGRRAGRSADPDGGTASHAEAGSGTPPAPTAPTRLPPPGILELEELLSNHLNTAREG